MTGGSQGYGRAIAEKLTREGTWVIVAARNRGPLEAAKEEIGCDGVLPMDVTSAADWERAAAHVAARYGGLDLLVNNAGGAVRVLETVRQEASDIDAIVALNLNSSVCAKHAWPGWSVYAAAKAGALAFSKGLCVELQPHNARVTCPIPAAGSTDLMKHAGGTKGVWKLRPEDVAEAAPSAYRLPQHVVVEELTVWGIDQEVEPL